MKTEKQKQSELPKLMEMQDAMAQMGAYINQMQRTLWLTIQAAGGKVELDEKSLNPLWRIDKIRKEDGTLILTSSVTPPPTQEQMDALVNKLRGTNLPVEDVQKELKLEDWPASYLIFHLTDRLLSFEGKWVDAEIVKAAATHRGQN